MTTISVDPRWEREVRRLAIESRLAGWHQGLYADMPVETTGRGRTRRWKGYRGTVRYIEGDQVHVEFDDRIGIAEQVLSGSELRPRVHFGCPCGQCRWEMEHPQR